MTRPAERIVVFYNHRGTADQWIKEGENAIIWACLSCRRFTANAVRLQLHALAYCSATIWLKRGNLIDSILADKYRLGSWPVDTALW